MTNVLTAEDIGQKGRQVARVLVADEISKEGVAILEAALEVVYDPDITAEKLLEIIDQFDALLVRSRTKVTKDVLQKGKRLKLVGSAGVGVLLLAAIPSTPVAVASLFVLALFTAVSMTALTTGFGLTLGTRPVAAGMGVVAPALGAMSLAFGLWYAAAAWSVAPYPF